MKFVTSFLLTMTLFSATAQAIPVGLDLVLVKGGVNRAQARQAFQYARAKLAPAGVKLKLHKLRIVPNTGPEVSLNNWNQQFWYWARWAWAHGYRRKRITYVMVPPFYSGGVPYIAGQSEGVCSPKGYAVGNAEMINHLGQNRFYHFATILAHEVGHLLGAPHIDTHSIMNIGALALSPIDGLTFDPSSIAKIRRCLGV